MCPPLSIICCRPRSLRSGLNAGWHTRPLNQTLVLLGLVFAYLLVVICKRCLCFGIETWFQLDTFYKRLVEKTGHCAAVKLFAGKIFSKMICSVLSGKR